MSSGNKTILVADIGGTNARFALVDASENSFSELQTLQCADFVVVEDAVDTYLSNHNRSGVDAICFAAAGPVINQTVRFTNNSWVLDAAALRNNYATSDVYLVNDWESISYSLPYLGSEDCLAIGSDWNLPRSTNFTFAAVGAGTGLGVTGLCGREGQIFSILSEGGHTSFAPQSALQLEVFSILLDQFGRVSNERLLSGPGLINIYRALCEIEDTDSEDLTASQIGERARADSSSICSRTLDLFFNTLGHVAGDFVLSLGAYDGLFIGGGIAQRYSDLLLQSSFREGFANKGRYKSILEKTPSWLITHSNPGLLGASVYVQQRVN